MLNLKKSWKAYGGALTTGVMAYVMQAMGLVEVVDASAMSGMQEAFSQLGTALVASATAYLGVYFAPKNVDAE